MADKKIKAVVFDVGGVLFLERYDFFRAGRNLSESVNYYMAKKLGVNLDAWFDAINDAHALANVGRISEKKAVGMISGNIGVSPARMRKFYADAYNKYFKHNEKLYKVAFELKKKGYKIGILSDQWAVSKKAAIKKQYTGKFDAVIISCDVGVKKPDARIYKLLLKKLKIKAGEVVFIDNREWNLIPARKMGIKTILFRSNRQALSELRRFGVEI